MSDTVEIDLTYAISEIQDIQSELELHNLSEMASRLEGVEARVKEIADALDILTADPGMSYFTAAKARTALNLPPRPSPRAPTYRG